MESGNGRLTQGDAGEPQIYDMRRGLGILPPIEGAAGGASGTSDAAGTGQGDDEE